VCGVDMVTLLILEVTPHETCGWLGDGH